MEEPSGERDVDVVVIGERPFVVLDGEDGPGGAWRHRWASLRMETVNGIFDLPGFPVPSADPNAPSRDVLPDYFAAYEERFELRVRRPVRVTAVLRRSAEPTSEPDGRLIVETDAGTWIAEHVINATGTWTRPHWPHYPGRERFRGRQLHVQDYRSADEFAGQRVVIVGAGISATQLLEEISLVADTFWVTRRPPVWHDEPTQGQFVEALEGVEERTRLGLAPTSVISVTGMHRTPWIERADARGVLVRHPMFTSIEEHGVRMPDGSLEPADVILWATGFRPAVAHLEELDLQTAHGGIRVAKGRSLDEPRLFLIGYGPSQSTVGANRAGRDAVHAILTNPTGHE